MDLIRASLGEMIFLATANLRVFFAFPMLYLFVLYCLFIACDNIVCELLCLVAVRLLLYTNLCNIELTTAKSPTNCDLRCLLL